MILEFKDVNPNKLSDELINNDIVKNHSPTPDYIQSTAEERITSVESVISILMGGRLCIIS